MTFRAKPVVKRSQRSWDSRDRRNFYLNLGFGLVVVASVLILVIAAALTWYDAHLASVASVNGQTITKDDLRTRYDVERFRIEMTRRRIANELSAGRLTSSQADQQTQLLDQRSQQLASLALERIIDTRIQGQLAAQEGIAVDDADIDAQITKEATVPEQRRSWVIEVKPEISTGATEPTAAQKAAAKTKADDALKEIKAGKKWEDVAKATSTGSNASQGGDAGWLTSQSTAYDQSFVDALFKLQPNGLTDVVEGADGTYRIGRVTDVAASSVDPNWEAQLSEFDVSVAAYRDAVRADVVRQKLSDKVVADASKPGPQRRVQEIWIEAPQETPAEGSVKVRHILYSPDDDPQKASTLKPDDPAWEKAHQDAIKAYDAIKADPRKFDEIARAESDEPSAKTTGGKLPYFDPLSQIDEKFAAAIFKPGLQPGQLLEPVQSSFGWHVIQVMYFPPDLAQAKKIKEEADKGADFGQLAKDNSDADTAANGGNLGWVTRDQLDPKLQDPVFNAPVPSVTDPIEVDGVGVYVYKILEEATRTPDADQLAKIKASAFGNWYAKEKEAFKIDRNGSAATSAVTQ